MLRRVVGAVRETAAGFRPMPNPPDYVPPQRSPAQTWAMLRRACGVYADTWRTTLGLETRHAQPSPQGDDAEYQRMVDENRRAIEELAGAARATADAADRASPLLQQVFASRVVALKLAVKEFSAGYREGRSQDEHPR